jgi:hypothetical protein
LHISLECRASLTGSWNVRLEHDVSTQRWNLAVTQQSFRQLIVGHRYYDPAAGVVRFERLLSPSEESALDDLLAATTLPLIPESAAGLDGTTWRLGITHGWNTVELAWWPDLPRAWEGLRLLIEFLSSLAEVHWDPDAEPPWDPDESIDIDEET